MAVMGAVNVDSPGTRGGVREEEALAACGVLHLITLTPGQ